MTIRAFLQELERQQRQLCACQDILANAKSTLREGSASASVYLFQNKKDMEDVQHWATSIGFVCATSNVPEKGYVLSVHF